MNSSTAKVGTRAQLLLVCRIEASFWCMQGCWGAVTAPQLCSKQEHPQALIPVPGSLNLAANSFIPAYFYLPLK